MYGSDVHGRSCGFDGNFLEQNSKAKTHFVALANHVSLNPTAYNKERNCGRCVRFKCKCKDEQIETTDGKLTVEPCKDVQGKEVVAMVIDKCGSCKGFGDLDLSIGAWADVTGGEGEARSVFTSGDKLSKSLLKKFREDNPFLQIPWEL